MLTLLSSDCYAIAAGMIAGEGLGGIVGAVLQVAKVSGNIYGSKFPVCLHQVVLLKPLAAVGCPAFEYCG